VEILTLQKKVGVVETVPIGRETVTTTTSALKIQPNVKKGKGPLTSGQFFGLFLAIPLAGILLGYLI